VESKEIYERLYRHDLSDEELKEIKFNLTSFFKLLIEIDQEVKHKYADN